MSETKVGEHELIGHMVTKITCCHLDNSQIHLANLRRVTLGIIVGDHFQYKHHTKMKLAVG